MKRRPSALLAVLVAALLGAAPAALGSASQESTFQDDNLLVYGKPKAVGETLDTLKGLGVDRIRVSVFWRIVAPAPDSPAKPDRFDGTDPAAYPKNAWDRYDTLLSLAAERGIAVNLDITSPAPNWATGTPQRTDIDPTYEPSAAEFGAFVRAVATRYSGSYVPPKPAEPAADPPPPPPILPPLPTRAAGPEGALPRVTSWSVWNEPNQAGWLTPQWVPDPGNAKQWVEAAPRIYRDLVDAAWTALQATGHGHDTILVGETAPKGLLALRGTTRSIDAQRFIRALYCLDDHLQVLRGPRASARGCPVSDQIQQFPAQHPGLFAATGWAHHPYELTFAPNRLPRHRDQWVTIANLNDLGRLLRRIHQRYGQGSPRVPLYLTEFGYQTNPPDPLGVTPAVQARYLDQSEYIAWRNPAVRTLAQFLLVDDGPPIGTTFQSGLMTADGKPKPAFNSYAMPVWLPREHLRRGERLPVWGLVRAAPDGQAQRVALQIRNRGATAWRTVQTVTSDARRGYLSTRIAVRRSGSLRLAWVAGATTRLSRTASFSVG
jgi:hypothetical protein